MEPMMLSHAVLGYDTLEERWKYDALWIRRDNLSGEHRASGWLTKVLGPDSNGETEARMLAGRLSGISPSEWVIFIGGKVREKNQ